MTRANVSLPSIYAFSVDCPGVQAVIERAALIACQELDSLFPDDPSDSRGISPSFQSLLESHLRAMLVGQTHGSVNSVGKLPALLAGPTVFGVPFSLPDIAGAGYLVFRPCMDQVLRADTRRFVPSRQSQLDSVGNEVRMTRQPLASQGQRLVPVDMVTVTFPTYADASDAALEALVVLNLSPQDAPIHIVGVVPDEDGGFRVL